MTEETKTIKFNPLGETQRDQWHAVVGIMRRTHTDMRHGAFCALCDELDRYIDFCEDIFDEERDEEEKSSSEWSRRLRRADGYRPPEALPREEGEDGED